MNALVSHPLFGSLWLTDVYVEDGFVVGEASDDRGVDPYGTSLMNFPLSCVRKWDPPADSPAAPERSEP